jgi:Protein of unknown function (DUF3667)
MAQHSNYAEKAGAVRPSETPPDTCPSCGQAFMGKFCHECGEKRITVKDFKVGKYVRSLLEHFSHFDSKMLRTFGMLLRQPGRLTAEYVIGRRRLYLNPLQTFLLLNLFFFLIFGDNDAFAPKLKYIYHSDMRLLNGQAAKAWADNYATQEGISIEMAISTIDSNISTLTKGLLYLMVPFLGLGFWALFYRKNPLYLCHLVFATHWLAFFLLFLMLIGVTIALTIRVRGLAFIGILLAALLPFHLIATRNFYGGSWLSLSVKSLLFLGYFAVIYAVYRELILLVSYFQLS